MSERAPRLTSVELIRALKKLGFVELRTKGSHVIPSDSQGRRKVTIASQWCKMLPIGTFTAILDDAEISVDELRGLI